MQVQNIKISKLRFNDGQIDGLPKNPRFIRDYRFEKLVQSLKDDPEMLEIRELIVIPFNDCYLVIGGNMRLRAMRELGFTEAICKVLPEDTPVKKLRAYAIKDNVAYGSDDNDALANEWDAIELEHWGVEFPIFEEPEEEKETLPKADEDNMIAITLTDEEKAEWENAKAYVKLKDDKKSLFKIILRLYEAENN
ncbi:hypothetical protein [Epilithonimonas xixisoli]|uniref:ParB-like N-terminal domain-containing protein n=1 Tax=Epilithonimonas xixisoli TaxID=1476462 RepID=A0A4R8IE21_9FLAO|nr:hypothetical protein [Epilithonimonas xixisoli]TDX83958.1 hypothetical protein B0I22_1546 [Epilithonimonas xixisoli]